MVYLRGPKRSYRELTFIAIPDEGYEVCEWMFNGEVVEGNKSNRFTARVSYEMNNNGTIVVTFEPISNNQE